MRSIMIPLHRLIIEDGEPFIIGWRPPTGDPAPDGIVGWRPPTG